MKLSPLDSWWRDRYDQPFGGVDHRMATPITQTIDYVGWVRSLQRKYADILERHEKNRATDEEIRDFLGNTEGLEHLKDLL